MGKKKIKRKSKKNIKLKIVYVIFAIIVLILGFYYEKGYKDVNTFVSDILNTDSELYKNFKFTSATIDDKNTSKTTTYKAVNGTLEMHIIDVGQRR